MLIIESLLIISLCFSILYIITASIKLLKNHEKNLNFGFNLSIVLTFLLTLISFYLESEGWWTFCIGLCSTSDLDLFILFCTAFCSPSSPFVAYNNLAGDWPKKKILFWCDVIHSFLCTCDLLLWNTRNYSLCFQFLIIPSAIPRELLVSSEFLSTHCV